MREVEQQEHTFKVPTTSSIEYQSIGVGGKVLCHISNVFWAVNGEYDTTPVINPYSGAATFSRHLWLIKTPFPALAPNWKDCCCICSTSHFWLHGVSTSSVGTKAVTACLVTEQDL